MKKNLKLKKAIFFLSLSSLLSLPLISLACVKNDFNAAHDNYISWKNAANKNVDFSYSYPNGYDETVKNIDLLTGSKALRIGSQKQPKIDFRDSIALQPTELYYKFEYAKAISLLSDSGNHQFTTDTIKKTIYQDTPESQQDSEYFYPKKDKGNGFNKPYLFVPSGKSNSINSPEFKKQLKEGARRLSLSFKSSNYPYKNYWINSKGYDFDKKYEVTYKDFLFGLLKVAMQNKEFRDKYIETHNLDVAKELERKHYSKDNPYFNGIDFFAWLENFGVDANRLLDFSLKDDAYDSIDFHSLSNQDINFEEFFHNLFIYSNYFNALPLEYIKDKYGPDVFSGKNALSWFYDYGRNHETRLYSSYYYVTKNDANETKLYRNVQYQSPSGNWHSSKHLNEIVYRYNPIPIGNETFQQQMYNAFRQNIVSELNVDQLSSDAKDEIFKNYQKYNLSYNQTFEKYRPHNSVSLNHFPKSASPYFNDSFSKLYYGVSLEELSQESLKASSLISAKSLIFKSLLNNVINPYALSQSVNDSDVWMSQAPSDATINATNSETSNYRTLKDAHANINKQILLENENSLNKANVTTQHDNKKHNLDPQALTSLDLQMRSIDFEYIKKTLGKMIDDFYQANSNAPLIKWTIPIVGFTLTKRQNEIVNKIKQTFKSIHSKLDPDVVVVDNYDKYQEYFLRNKSIYQDKSFILENSNSSDFVRKSLVANNFELLLIIKKLHTQNLLTNAFPELNKLANDIFTQPDINSQILSDITLNDFYNNTLKNHLDQKKLNDRINLQLNKLSITEIVNLINEINNFTAYTISFQNAISLANFSKMLYQKFLIKPISYDGLEYLQDILVDEK
ncbi:Uncharacterised protein [Metamycoplasma arthritidis]|uniref:Hypothetical lipoprotein n=1 Tax=Metamycoplasma arthritidis (strain 158L3-1) TaxID=243272 RepID=B3PLX6_META1|nr:hypothetical protein [Metamycoplasma arthritidis]ACF07028.1 hypothetical lipoprotein [Metamycoplasma arthritidis 158L3-1]VEU78556.1 Uncharacterised protein [Metamycoplasma arthritidis]